MEMTLFSSSRPCGSEPDENDESTLLCARQKIRRYGSTNSELTGGSNNPSSSCSSSSSYGNFRSAQPPKCIIKVVTHQVEPSDTLQSLELKYNSSMFEIKRVNRLWSDACLHCKTHVDIPVFETTHDGTEPPSSSGDQAITTQPLHHNGLQNTRAGSLERVVEEHDKEESLDQFFNRIDKSVKMTQKAVKKLNRAHSTANRI